MKTKKVQIIILIFLSIMLIFNSISMANSMKYQLNGLIDTIVTANVALSYQSDGLIDKISVNNNGTNVTITLQSDGLLDTITTPSGMITFQSDGLLDSVVGNWNSIYNDVQSALEIANTEIIGYITSINIQVPGASNPSESAPVITQSLNEIIDMLNEYSSYSNSSTSNNGGTSVNSNGIDVNILGLGGISVNEDGINVNSANNGSLTVNGNNNNMFMYIIVAVICYVVLLTILFVIKAVQGEKGNVKLIKILMAIGTLIFVVVIAGIVLFNVL